MRVCVRACVRARACACYLIAEVVYHGGYAGVFDQLLLALLDAALQRADDTVLFRHGFA